MTTFKLPPASMSLDPDELEDPLQDDTLNPMPNINVTQPSDSHFLSSSDGSGIPLHADGAGSDSESQPDPDYLGPDGDYPLIATQPQTQSQHRSYDPELDQHLVGCLFPATGVCQRFELRKDRQSLEWKLGRHRSNDFVLDGPRLSNFHCTLRWNGKQGRQSEVSLADSSTNGTWINNAYVVRGQTSILRSGAAISFGAGPEALHNDYRFIFRDIEGQSTRHANQIWAKYDVGHELGSGAFARVHKCIERATGLEYAVKIIDKGKLRRSHANEQSVVREIAVLKQLGDFRHKNIVALHEHFEEEEAIYLIMELVHGGDLLTYIGVHGALPEDQVRRMAAQICHAVAYVHSQGIAHRDLKPENVMITATEPPDCKVADFGLAKLVDSQTFLKTMCGTPAYLAPEVMLRPSPYQAYDNRVDSWSLGIIFYCMLTNHAPFHEAYDPAGNAAQRLKYFGSRKVDWELLRTMHISDDGYDFIRNLLTEDPRKRKDVIKMLDHHWISHLVNSDSQYQHTQPQLPSTPATTTDGAVACSQSFQALHLSDIPIPGLNQGGANGENMSVPPQAAPIGVDSMTSEVSVTSRIPGAFPKAKGGTVRQGLVAVEEAVAENGSWEFVIHPITANKAGTSQRSGSPTRVSAKRKSNLIAGSSPLSSLPSDDEDESTSESPKKAVSRQPRRSKGKALASPTNKRKTGRGKAANSQKEDDCSIRKSGRRQPKAPRHA